MSPVRRRTHTGRVAGRRRELVWATTDQSVALGVAGNANTDLVAGLEVAGSSVLGLTVMRTHLRVTVTTGVAKDLLRIGVGLGKSTDVGNPIPAGALNPSQPGFDWMLLDRRVLLGQGSNVSPTPEFEYDLKSRRRMHELQQTIILSLFTNSGAGTTVNVWCRMLLALP